MYNKLGKRVRERRRELQMSAEDLAEKVNLSKNFIGNIERNESFPRFTTLVALAEALNVNVDYLCQDYIINPDAKRFDPYTHEMLSLMSKLSDKQKYVILHNVKSFMNFHELA